MTANITVEGFVSQHCISATIDGVNQRVVDDPFDRHRKMVAEWEAAGNTIPAFVEPPTYVSANQAKAAMVAWAEDFARSVTGAVPIDEKLSWPIKEAAARAVDSGTEDARQMAMITQEALLTGETPAELATKIIGKADLYRSVVAQIAGLRRATEAALEAEAAKVTPDPHQYEAILSAAKTQAAQLAAALGL